MMKKISRIAALLAATALLFGAIGCSDDDEEPTPAAPAAPVDTVSPASFELTSGAEAVAKPFTLTLGTTQINEAGLAALKKVELSEQNEINAIVKQSGSDITVSKVALTEDATATTLKLSLTMASSAAAGTKGTLTLTLSKDYTENGKDVMGTLNYEIKANTTITPGEDDDPNTPASAKTYDFATWSEADLATFGDGQYTDSKGTAKNTLKSPEGSTELSTGATIYNKNANAIMIRTVSTTDTTPTGLNYNGGIATNIANGVTIADLDRYIKIPVDGAGTVTASIKAVNSSKNSGTLQIALVDKDGKLIGDLVTANVADGKITGSDATTGTVTGTVTAATDVYLAFSRNGANGGGLDVYSITVAPKN